VPVLADLAVKISEKMPVSRKLKTSLFCGEALPMETALQFGRRLVESHEVWNLYGPTEATIAISVRNVTDVKNEISIAPLGKAYGANVLGIQVKNGDIKTEFSEGMEGQLLLGGPQVFGGYSPKVDKDVFVEYGEINFYKSGDLVKFSQNELLYLGRLDHQVKIRGHRVELSEIEVAFRKVSGVKMVAAYTIGEIGDKQIHLAYQSDQNIENFSELKDYLPDYMIPVKYIHFVELPTNENGKIDRNAIKVITQ
jgi:acyl-CoA synthetase (AMP-forming)/AMP-acid ligase II